MSGYTELTVKGGYDHVNGVVSVPSAFSGATSTPGSLNDIMQAYLSGIASQFGAGAYSFENNDIADGVLTVNAGSVSGSYEEFTNVNPTSGVISTVTVSGTYAVNNGNTDLVVEAPGNETLTGVGTTTTAIFGASSNVNYSVTDPAAGTLYLAGGANSVSLYTSTLSQHNAETIYSAGQDTINLVGQGTDYVSVYGSADIYAFSANEYVTAEGNATVNLFWDSSVAGGQLHFVNSSTVPATIHIGNFGGETATTKVTAYGGAGGGFFVGGSAGNNSLVGGSVAGSGVVTLLGGGTGDFLEATADAGSVTSGSGSNTIVSPVFNYLYAGPGTETLVGSALSGSNVFYVGLNQPGLSNAPAASGIVSTDGSGAQQFYFGNVPGGEKVYLSTVSSASNTLFIDSGTVPASLGGGSVGGGLYNIYNFVNADILLTNFGNTAGGATITYAGLEAGSSTVYQISLSDQSTILIHGLSQAALTNGLETINAGGISIITSTPN